MNISSLLDDNVNVFVTVEDGFEDDLFLQAVWAVVSHALRGGSILLTNRDRKKQALNVRICVNPTRSWAVFNVHSSVSARGL